MRDTRGISTPLYEGGENSDNRAIPTLATTVADNNNPTCRDISIAALVPFLFVFKLTLSALASVILLGACSSSTASEYQSLCDLSIRMDAASAGPHGQDPGAITDPERMKEMRATITELALQMRDESPAEIKDDVTTMVDSIIAMDKVFSDNNYDLTAMARIEEVRNTMDAISTDPKVVEAKQRYSAFMEKNCGPLSQ